MIRDVVPDASSAILDEASAGTYDTLVLSRRGRNAIKEFLLGSVTSKVLHQANDCAVWIVE